MDKNIKRILVCRLMISEINSHLTSRYILGGCRRLRPFSCLIEFEGKKSISWPGTDGGILLGTSSRESKHELILLPQMLNK